MRQAGQAGRLGTRIFFVLAVNLFAALSFCLRTILSERFVYFDQNSPPILVMLYTEDFPYAYQ